MPEIRSQITVSGATEGGEAWASAQEARDSGAKGFVPSRANQVDGRRFNIMPAGMDINNQLMAEINDMPSVVAGASDPAGGVGTESMRRGFARLNLNDPCPPDLFDDSSVGFATL